MSVMATAQWIALHTYVEQFISRETASANSMKEYRVIFQLANGKRKYATHNGEVLLWDDYDILALRRNLVEFEQFAFTEDFKHFAFSADELARKFPRTKIIRVKGFRTESPDVPLNSKITL